MKAVIFDVDGTLYNQSKLRLRVLSDMVAASLRHPSCIYEFKLIWDFRKSREQHATLGEAGIEDRQYAWGAKRSGVSEKRVRNAVHKWMFKKPLRHLPECKFKGIVPFFQYLQEKDIRIGIFSDYPAKQKLDMLGLQADVIVCSLDMDVDRLKPDPKGLVVAAKKLGVSVRDCLFIGDRDDKDGECARRAEMPFIIIDQKQDFYCSKKTYNEIDFWING